MNESTRKKIIIILAVICFPITILILPVWVIYKAINNKNDLQYTTQQNNINQEEQIDYSKGYQPKYLLTKNEWHEYKKLKDLAAGKGLQICPKVRLLDLVTPRKDQGNYKTLLYKVQAKHVDFVITDQDLRIKAILELDDGSHDSKNRQERDLFVDEVLTACGYNVIRTRSITPEIIENL